MQDAKIKERINKYEHIMSAIELMFAKNTINPRDEGLIIMPVWYLEGMA